MHHFMISICDARLCPKWPSLMKGTGTKEQLKFLSLKIEEAMSKSVAITEKKNRKTIYYTNHKHQSWPLPTKVTLIIDFTD